MTGQYAEDSEADVDEKVGAAACDDVDADGRDCKRADVSLDLGVGITWMRRTEDGDNGKDNCRDHFVGAV